MKITAFLFQAESSPRIKCRSLQTLFLAAANSMIAKSLQQIIFRKDTSRTVF
jgi:hypothetical protein